ncbi:MAG TPA: 2,5-dihydroxypyridine 5,6-dioxygenase [Acetobacteraceae bacterium]|nr:2,5-dihydroxypyridine 5,6-dioxygenase [Acetobacteraceae bacterium]
MLSDRIEGKWLDAFREVLSACGVKPGEAVAILSETQSRALNVHLAELALHGLGARAFHLVVPTPRNPHPVPVRSTGASEALAGLEPALAALGRSGLVVDLTLEGLMHARETPTILGAGARILHISNEHPEALERLRPDPALEDQVRQALRLLRGAATMSVTSAAGTDLTIDLREARTVGVWGWTTRPGTLAHWPGGLVLAFPAGGTVDGALVLDRGDVNLTFKRYLESRVRLIVERDHVVAIEGEGSDAALMRAYLEAWGDRNAYAVSHVGWGLNRRARYEALAMYDQRETNGTELRAVAGNFLFSTGANEFAGRHTAGHFDLPVMRTTIELDGTAVVREGVLLQSRRSTDP